MSKQMNINFRLDNSFSLYSIIILFLLSSCNTEKDNMAIVYCKQAGEKYMENDFDGAINDLNEAIKLDPQYAPAYNLRGHCKQLRDHDLNGAIDDYNRAIKLKPDFAYAYINRGEAYRQLKDYKKALKDYDKCIKYAPRFIEGYKKRASTKSRLEDFNGAIDDYTIILTLEPDNCFAYAERGHIKYFKLGDYIGACKDLTLAEKYGCSYYSTIREKSCNK